MRKTFLKVALIGLLVGSLPVGFTSCKDYDDDIEQTNNQVADLKTKLASVETAIAALPSKADVTAAQAAAVAQAKADLEAVKAELQKAIDGKADKEAVEAINTELNSIKGQLETIEALKGQVSEAMDAINASIDEIKADAVTKGQMIAGLEGQIADLKKAQEEGATNVSGLTDELTALKAAVEDPTSGIAALKAQIEELAKQINGAGGDATSLEAVVRLMNGMITHIEVVTNGNANFDTDLNLFVVDVTEDLVFGKGLPGEITFTKGQEMLFTDSLLVRVSPANAVVTADQIQLVNSEGKDVSAFINVTEVKPFEGLLTGSRSIANNGLHVVKLELKKEYDRDAYQDATAVGEENDKDNVLFAVAVKDNEKELADNRDITSAYDVAIISKAPKAQYNLEYNVDKTSIYEIHNRFQSASDNSGFAYAKNLVTYPSGQYYAPFEEAYKYGQDVPYVWNYNFQYVGDYYYYQNKKGELFARWADDSNGQGANYDNRQGKRSLPVELGKKFTVELGGDNIDVKGIYGLYVALDMKRATESNGSERTAWEAYEGQISGINKVVNGTSVDLCLNMKNVEPGEEIGFRVWAVNYDGTLVDPDGRAFYVQVGESEVEAQGEVSFTLTATSYNSIALPAKQEKDAVDQLSGNWMNKYTRVRAEFTLDEDNPEYGVNSQVAVILGAEYDANGDLNGWYVWNKTADNNNLSTLYRNDETGYDAYFESINIKLSDAQFVDGAEYTGKLKIYATDNNNQATSLLQTIAIKFVKNIPTTMPANAYSVKPGQVTDGKINAYVGTDTEFDLKNVFTFGANMSETIVYAADNKPKAVNGVIPVASGVVNNNKYYALNLAYTYYNVSYVWDDEANDGEGVYKSEDVTIAADTYQISFNTLTNAYKFAWGVEGTGKNAKSKAPVLYQGKDNTETTFSDIQVTSSMEADLDKTLAELMNSGITVTGVKTTGDIANYFKATASGEYINFTALEANPVGQISGNLEITYKGEDGIACKKTLPIQMNVPQN